MTNNNDLKNNGFLEEEEIELIKKAASGDNKAFSKIYYQYKELVYRVVYRLLGGTEDIHDAVQQTFIELFKSLPGYAGKSKFTTWLYRIAVNVSIQFFRKKRVSEKFKTSEWELDTIPSSDTTSMNIERKELKTQLEEALSSLQLKKRIVIVLHDIEHKTMEEISEIIGVPVGTIKSRLFYAREELKKKLGKILEE